MLNFYIEITIFINLLLKAKNKSCKKLCIISRLNTTIVINHFCHVKMIYLLKLLLSKILIFCQSKSFCHSINRFFSRKNHKQLLKKRKRNDGCNPSSNNVQIIHGLVKLRNLAKHRPPSIQCSLSQIIMFVRFIYRAFYRNGFRVGANNKLD